MPLSTNLSAPPVRMHSTLFTEGCAAPKYEQLRRKIREQIASGQLKPGDPLPTERDWSESSDLARSTVRQAMSLLERDGLIRRVQGRGTFVHENVCETFRRGLDAFALVLPETESGYYPSLLRSFEESASRVHHQLLVCNTGNNIERQGNIILQLLDKQVAGVAMVPVACVETPGYQVRPLSRAGIPLVLCHRRVQGVTAPLLCIPFPKVGRLAAEALCEQGHRRVGFLTMGHSTSSRAHEEALRAGLRSVGQGGRIPEGCCYHGPNSPRDCADHKPEIAQALAAMLSQRERPTALFASFDPLAELLYILLAEFGLRVPEDISLIGFGGTSRTTPLSRCLTSVTIDEGDLGRRAANLLEQMRTGALAMDAHETYDVNVTMSIGQTLGPAPAAPLRSAVKNEKGTTLQR